MYTDCTLIFKLKLLESKSNEVRVTKNKQTVPKNIFRIFFRIFFKIMIFFGTKRIDSSSFKNVYRIYPYNSTLWKVLFVCLQ